MSSENQPGKTSHQLVYNAGKAWIRAAVFFFAALLIGLWSGVTPSLLTPPLFQPGLLQQGGFWVTISAYAIVVIIGYGFIWPRGTLTYGRPLRPAACLFFGLMWGLAQAQIFLAIWTLASWLDLGAWWTAGITYAAIAIYNGLWHSLYWDIHVSPPHNIEAWNGRKIAFAHTPNLLATLLFLGLFGNFWVVVMMQCLALVLSCWFMHFPQPGDCGAPELETV